MQNLRFKFNLYVEKKSQNSIRGILYRTNCSGESIDPCFYLGGEMDKLNCSKE
jgi:hypothetical protein